MVTGNFTTGAAVVGNVPRRRWFIAVLLGFGILVNYFDRVNLSVSRDALRDAFGISTVLFGFLLSAYNWPYMVRMPIVPAPITSAVVLAEISARFTA